MRLTIRNGDGSVSQPTNTTIKSVFEKLAEYEDLEEHEQLVKTPCKIGDTLWLIENDIVDYNRETKEFTFEKNIYEVQVRSISIFCNSKNLWTKKVRVCRVHNNKPIDKQRDIEFKEFGKTAFFTPEEAEAALKGADE